MLEDLNAKILHHADSENAAIPHFEIKITEIPQEKLSNTANAWKRLHKHQCPPQCGYHSINVTISKGLIISYFPIQNIPGLV